MPSAFARQGLPDAGGDAGDVDAVDRGCVYGFNDTYNAPRSTTMSAVWLVGPDDSSRWPN